MPHPLLVSTETSTKQTHSKRPPVIADQVGTSVPTGGWAMSVLAETVERLQDQQQQCGKAQ